MLGSLKAQGVAIAVSKNLPLQNPQCLKDPSGRFLFVKCSIEDNQDVLASLYAPNSHQLTFLCDTLIALKNFGSGEFLIRADLNMIIDPRMDKAMEKK